MLGDYGSEIELFTAHNGLEALQLIRTIQFDLVATDFCMPQMSGLELLEVLSKEYPELPVFAWSAYVTPTIRDKFSEMGAMDFFELPLDFGAFLNTVRSILDGTFKLKTTYEDQL